MFQNMSILAARRGDLVLTPMGLRAFGRLLPCTIGRGGIVPGAFKRDGDGGTPTGRRFFVTVT